MGDEHLVRGGLEAVLLIYSIYLPARFFTATGLA